MAATYLLICVDGMDAAGNSVSAHHIASSRLNAMQWPLYKGTGYAKRIQPGDTCLIYVGGQREHSQTFVGVAVVGSVDSAPRNGTVSDSSLITEPAARLIDFARVKQWTRPVSIRDHLDELRFIKNRARWGLHVMGGVKRIPAEDFDLICNAHNTE